MGVVRTSRAGSIVGLVATAALVLPVLQGISWALPPGPSDPCTIKGTDGPDTLTGTAGDDVICGRGGDDTINGLAGDDVIRAGDGNDEVNGGGGVDRIVGGAGDDTLSGGDDADVVRGQGGIDLLIGGNGDDDLAGGADNDDVRGGAGADRVTGSADDDVVNGGADNDVVFGRGGVDSLLGSTGDDSLYGGAGNDTVSGGDDADEVHGGPGDDQLFGGDGDDLLVDRDGAGFVDNAVCGAGNDQANVDVYDTVSADCEIRRNADRDAPVAVDDAATVVEDDPATTIDVRANDTDTDGGLKTVESTTQPGNGTVVITNSGDDLTYEPDPDFCNDPPGTTTDDFTYTLNGGSTATVAITVTCEDDDPLAVDDSATVAEDDAATTIDVRGNDTDVDGGTISIGSVTQPGNGTVVITNSGDDLTYEPDPDYCNTPPGTSTDDFTYTLNGGDTATVSVSVTCVNDDPVGTDDSATVVEDDPASAVDVLANDIDVDGDIAIDSVTQPANGTVVITGSGAGLTYEPDPDYCNDPPGTTTDDFTYTLDGGDTATVSVTVTCVDDDPVAVDDSATVGQDAPATPLDVLANDTDIDAGPLTIASATDPANGTVVLTGGSLGAHTGLTYEPDSGYCNDPGAPDDDTFTYTLNGGSTATVSVVVSCDVPPVAVDDIATVDEDGAATTLDVLVNDTDTDGGPISIASITQPANGTVVITNGGDDLTYEPDPNFCNNPPGTTTDDFTYTLTPGTSTATVSVTVTCIDDDPVSIDDATTVVEDATAAAIDVLANDTDIDAGLMRISSASDPANGVVVLTGGSPGAHTGLTYQPDPNYCNDPPATTPDTFTYTLNGGSTATVSVTVTCVDDAATIDNSAGDTSYVENDPATVVDGAIVITNVDGLTITAASADISGGFAAGQDALDWVDNNLGDSITEGSSTNQTILLTGNGTAGEYEAALEAVTYTNSSNDPNTAPRTITFSISTSPGSPSDTKGLTVTAVDDAPTAVNDSTTLLEDAAATAIGVLANDTDIDAGPKTISSASDPANGTVVLTGGSSGAHTGLTYQPDPNYCNDPPGTTPDTFTYTLNGGSTATVSVTVTCVNDAPVADDETFNGVSSAVGNTALVVNDTDDTAPALSAPKKSISGDILAGDTDVDGPGPLTVTPGTFASNDGGSVTIEADGDFIFRPAAVTSCTDASDFFDYTVEDSGTPEQTDVGRVTIALTGCVWYVNNNDPSGNAGTSTAPFDTLAHAETASAAGHTIFVFDGDNTTTGYAAGINLKANQVLTSEAANLVVGADTLHTGVPGARPTLTDNNADVVDLDDSTTVRGFVIDPQGTGGGIAGSTGDTGGGTIDNVSITDTGTPGSQPMLELDATTGTFNLSSFDVDTSGATTNPNTATGVRLNNAGTVVFAPTGTITLTTEGAKALDATGTAFGTSTIDAITVTASGVGAISLVNTTATALALGDDSGTDLNLTTTGGTAFLLNNATNVTVGTDGTDEVHATAGPAIDITGAGSFAFDDTDSTNSNGDGINLAAFGTGTFSTPTGSTVSDPAGIGFDLDGGSGAVTYDGTITDDVGQIVRVQNTTAGLKDFNGNVTDNGDGDGGELGILLQNNTGSTIRFDGGVTVRTTTNPAFTATGGGTVVVTDPNSVGTAPDNTLTAASATALNVATTAIGAGGLNFRSISAGNTTAAADPVNGIVLSNTGSTAGLTVTGTGAPPSGGTIQNVTGDGIQLSSASAISLTDMSVTSAGGSWVDASTVTGLTLTRMSADLSASHGLLGSSVRNLVISGGTFDRGGQAAGFCNVNGVNITNLLGTSSVTGATFARSNTIQFRVNNNTATNFAGTPDTLTVSGTTWRDHNFGGCFGDHLSVNSDTGGNFRLMVNSTSGINIVNSDGDANGGGIGVQATAGGTNGKMSADVTGLRTSNNTAGAVMAATGSGSIVYNVHDNNTDPVGTVNDTGFSGTGSLALAATCTTTASCVGTWDNNSIAHTAGAGTDAAQAVLEGNGTHTIAIRNNDITGNFQRGINLSSGGGTGGVGTLNATVTGNLVSGTDPASLQGINITAGLSGSPGNGETNRVCLNLVNNNSSQASGQVGYRFTNRASNTFLLQDFSGNGANAADITAWVNNAPKSNVGTVAVQNAPTTFGPLAAAPSPCPVPS